MRSNIIILILLYCALQVAPVHAQDARQLFQQAFAAYETGDYNSSLTKLNELEARLGQTNPRIQSLKTQAYYQAGHFQKALETITLYFNTSPDQATEEYQSMVALHTELKEAARQQQVHKKQEIERLRRQELGSAAQAFSLAKDQHNFKIAREANTVEAYEAFLVENQTAGLETEAKALLAEAKKERAYRELETEGLKLLASNQPREAAAKFGQAEEIKLHSAINLLKQQALVESAAQALALGNREFLDQHWEKAIQHYQYAQSADKRLELTAKLKEAQELLLFDQALKANDPEALEKYLVDYPKGQKINQAHGILFYHYLQQAEAGHASKNTEVTQQSLAKAAKFKTTVHWNEFSEDYYALLLAEAKRLTSGEKDFRVDNVGTAIAYFKELQQESGSQYESTVKRLDRKWTAWTRPSFGYFGIRTDANLAHYGFDFGFDFNRGIGGGVKLVMPKEMFVNSTFELPEHNHIIASINGNVSKKVTYPLWVTLGGGWMGYQKITPDEEDPTKGEVLDDEKLHNTFNLEAGVNLHFKALYLSATLSRPFLSAAQQADFGYTKAPTYLTFALGFSWQ